MNGCFVSKVKPCLTPSGFLPAMKVVVQRYHVKDRKVQHSVGMANLKMGHSSAPMLLDLAVRLLNNIFAPLFFKVGKCVNVVHSSDSRIEAYNVNEADKSSQRRRHFSRDCVNVLYTFCNICGPD